MKSRLLLIIVGAIFLSGCSQTPLLVKEGMNSQEVKALWGQPREVKTAHNSCCLENGYEEWFYFNTRMMKPKRPYKYVLFEEGEVKYVFAWHKRRADRLTEKGQLMKEDMLKN